MRRHFLRATLASSLVLASAIGVQPIASAATPSHPQTQSTTANQPQLKSGEKILAVGENGFVRTVNTNDSGNHGRGEIRNDLKLAKGDKITLSSDRKTASIVDSHGNLLGSFVAPSIKVEGRDFAGVFKVDGDSLITGLPSDSPLMQERSCWRGEAAKWTWRGAGALTCGALGVATIVGGGACTLAWAGAEDAMNISGRAC